jgi:hypothetical protein
MDADVHRGQLGTWGALDHVQRGEFRSRTRREALKAWPLMQALRTVGAWIRPSPSSPIVSPTRLKPACPPPRSGAHQGGC